MQAWHSVLQPASAEHDLSQISAHCLQAFSQTATRSLAYTDPRCINDPVKVHISAQSLHELIHSWAYLVLLFSKHVL